MSRGSNRILWCIKSAQLSNWSVRESTKKWMIERGGVCQHCDRQASSFFGNINFHSLKSDPYNALQKKSLQKIGHSGIFIMFTSWRGGDSQPRIVQKLNKATISAPLSACVQNIIRAPSKREQIGNANHQSKSTRTFSNSSTHSTKAVRKRVGARFE